MSAHNPRIERSTHPTIGTLFRFRCSGCGATSPWSVSRDAAVLANQRHGWEAGA